MKYSTNFKEFNAKLIENTVIFKNYKVGEVKIKTSKELQQECEASGSFKRRY